MIYPEPGGETVLVDGVEFGLEGVVAESGVALTVVAWVVGSVVDGSVIVIGGSVGGKPPKKDSF